jgi:methionine-R-sulfoxide reductase
MATERETDSGREVEFSDEEWRRRLSPEQYEILRRHGTEPPFTGEYVHVKEDGTYRCAGCGAELFSSDTKFDSGTGWPSFYEPAVAANIETREDRSLFMRGTESNGSGWLRRRPARSSPCTCWGWRSRTGPVI